MQSTPDEYAVEHAYPVIGGFSIAMSQPRQSVADLGVPSTRTSFLLAQPAKTGAWVCFDVVEMEWDRWL